MGQMMRLQLCKENKTGIVVGAVYIRGGDVFKLIGIEDGSYDLYFKQGQSWNASLQKFDARQARAVWTIL